MPVFKKPMLKATDTRSKPKPKPKGKLPPIGLTKDDSTNVAVRKSPKVKPAASSKKTVPTRPDWIDWNQRPTVTLFHGICLAHGLNTNRDVVKGLIKTKTPATRKFQNHLNTLKNCLPHDDLLCRVDLAENELTDQTKIFLADFISWVEFRKPFSSLVLPQEFLKLNPPIPAKSVRGRALLRQKDAPMTTSGSDGIEFSGKSGRTMASVLLALAIRHYGYRPANFAKKPNSNPKGAGVYQEILKLCDSLKFHMPMHPETISTMLKKACEKIPTDELQSAIERNDEWASKNLSEF